MYTIGLVYNLINTTSLKLTEKKKEISPQGWAGMQHHAKAVEMLSPVSSLVPENKEEKNCHSYRHEYLEINCQGNWVAIGRRKVVPVSHHIPNVLLLL